MADYWKSIDKKWCDTCKCWLTDNKASIEFHENGNRHKMNVQNRLREIHKKNKTDMKAERKFENEMRKIEKAAAAASQKDVEENPDVSMKIQTYFNMLKEKSGGDLVHADAPGSSKKSKPTISHRSDKQKKADETALANLNKPVKGYQRIGGWGGPEAIGVGKSFLELPTKSSKSPGTSLTLSAKLQEEKPIVFGEKRVSSSETCSSTVVKPEGGCGEVTFKKRKLNKGGMRQREED